MQYLDRLTPEISEALGIKIMPAYPIYKGMNTLFYDGKDNLLCPNNSCELEGFQYEESADYVCEDDFGCSANLRGEKIKIVLFLYGKKKCEALDLTSIVQCLMKVKTVCEDINITIKPLGRSTNMPDVIRRHFAAYKDKFQDAQPCSTLVKLTYQLDVSLCC